jgi:hypothetical protein
MNTEAKTAAQQAGDTITSRGFSALMDELPPDCYDVITDEDEKMQWELLFHDGSVLVINLHNFIVRSGQ